MAYYFDEPSHTFSEYLLVPSYSSAACTPQNVSLKTPICKHRVGEPSPLSMSIPLVSAVMQSVSGEKLASALAREGGMAAQQTFDLLLHLADQIKTHVHSTPPPSTLRLRESSRSRTRSGRRRGGSPPQSDSSR